MRSTQQNINKSLVGLAIEQAILDTGGTKMFYEVLNFLYENYDSYTTDCLVHPQYLLAALKEQDRKYSSIIISLIMSKLEEYSYHKPIQNFLTKLNMYRWFFLSKLMPYS